MDLKTYLSELEYLVNIDSCSDDSEGLNRVAEFFSSRFREMGWNVHEHNFAPKSGTCVICTNREAEHYDLMLMGHLDTVFPKGTCAERPFRIEGDLAYGPGVADMKHGCLLMYYLLKELPKEVNDKLNIVAVFNPDEEIGSAHSKIAYLPYAEKSTYAYVYEAAAASGAHCVQRKGAVGLSIEFFGKAGPCGYVFENGALSAVSEMAKWIVALDELQSRERDTTVNVGIANGGNKSNVVADHAELHASVRFADPEEIDRLSALLEKLTADAKERGIETRITRNRAKRPLNPTEQGKAYIEHITAVAKSRNIDLMFKARGGLSDANLIAQCGPICLDGMGPSGGTAHAPGEYMMVDTVLPAFELSQLLIQDLADNK